MVYSVMQVFLYQTSLGAWESTQNYTVCTAPFGVKGLGLRVSLFMSSTSGMRPADCFSQECSMLSLMTLRNTICRKTCSFKRKHISMPIGSRQLRAQRLEKNGTRKSLFPNHRDNAWENTNRKLPFTCSSQYAGLSTCSIGPSCVRQSALLELDRATVLSRDIQELLQA